MQRLLTTMMEYLKIGCPLYGILGHIVLEVTLAWAIGVILVPEDILDHIVLDDVTLVLQ